jgi:hypothetical protein
MKMKIVLAFFCLGIFYGGSEVWGLPPTSDPSLPEISLQILVRDSKGNLVEYIEPTFFYIQYLPGVNDFLNNPPNDAKIKKVGNLETFEFQQWERIKTSHMIGAHGLYHNNVFVILFIIEGYFGEPGDTITTSWKITRMV